MRVVEQVHSPTHGRAALVVIPLSYHQALPQLLVLSLRMQIIAQFQIQYL